MIDQTKWITAFIPLVNPVNEIGISEVISNTIIKYKVNMCVESMLNIFLWFNFLTFLIKMPFFRWPESLVRKNHKICVLWLVESAKFFFLIPVWFNHWIGKRMCPFSVVFLYCANFVCVIFLLSDFFYKLAFSKFMQ